MCLSNIKKTVYVPRSRAIKAYKIVNENFPRNLMGKYHQLPEPQGGIYKADKNKKYDRSSPGLHAYLAREAATKANIWAGDKIITVYLWGHTNRGVCPLHHPAIAAQFMSLRRPKRRSARRA